MKYNKIHYIILSATFAISFQSCKKVTPDVNVKMTSYSLKFSRKGLDYVKLTEGKYLIYKDSASSQLDSVIVTRSVLENKYNPEDITWYGWISAYYHENISLTLTKFSGFVQTEWFSGEAKLWLGSPECSVDNAAVDLKTLDQFNNSYTKFYLGENDQTNYSVVIEGKTYNNVVKTIYDRGLDISNPDYLKETYYWAKGIGIIKKETIKTGGAIKILNLLRNN